MTIIWCMVSEIWNIIDRMFCHSGPFFALLPLYGPRKSKFWKNETKVWRHYHFTHLYNPKIWNFEKLKKKPGDIIILHMCTINDYHMMYSSWDMKHDRQNFFVILDLFCLFTPLTTQKIKILKKYTYNHTIQYNPVLYCSWDTVHDRCNCCFSFWAIFCPFTPLTVQKIKI